MNSFRKVVERVLMVVIFFIGTSLFFLLYTDIIQYRYIKQLCTQFAYEVAKDGVLSEADYHVFLDGLSGLETSIEVKLSHTGYEDVPYYAYCTEDEIFSYFSGRNKLPTVQLPLLPVSFPSIYPEKLKMQDKTNAGMLSSLSFDSYVPLPEDDVTTAAVYSAVCDTQRVYVGEELCTVVKVTENGLTYYDVADTVIVGFTGTCVYELEKNGIPTGAEVTISSYPRTVTCAYGHETLFSPERVAEYEATGEHGACTFCAMVPTDITASSQTVTAVIGTSLEDLGITVSVVYLDGHTEEVNLSDKELFSSYSASYCGEQAVQFSYKGFEKEVFTCNLTGGICSICGTPCSRRCKEDYDRFPYCDSCMVNIPLYRGETYSQIEFTDNTEIITMLQTQKVYYFERGDYFEIFLSYAGEGRAIPFLSSDIKMPVVIGGNIRTDGKRD